MKLSCLKHYLSLAAIGLLVLIFWVGVINWAIGSKHETPNEKLKHALIKNKCKAINAG